MEIIITDADILHMAEDLAQAYDGNVNAAVHGALRDALIASGFGGARGRREADLSK